MRFGHLNPNSHREPQIPCTSKHCVFLRRSGLWVSCVWRAQCPPTSYRTQQGLPSASEEEALRDFSCPTVWMLSSELPYYFSIQDQSKSTQSCWQEMFLWASRSSFIQQLSSCRSKHEGLWACMETAALCFSREENQQNKSKNGA